jgi:hypothetical protein
MPYPAFQEHEDSPVERGNRSGELQFTRIFLTAWDDRWLFIAEHFRSGPFGLPASYSSYWPGVLADTFDIGRISNCPDIATISDPNSQQLTHSGAVAKITINYSPLERDISEANDPLVPSGTWADYSQDSNIEFRTIPGRGMKWLSDSTLLPPDNNSITPEAVTTHQVTWNQLSVVPWQTIGNAKGCVNSVACRLPGSQQIFVPETLLFEGLADQTTISLTGQVGTRKLTLRFSEKAQKGLVTNARGGNAPAGSTVYGWNHQYRDDSGTYDKPLNKATGAPMFAVFDFNTLWTATV